MPVKKKVSSETVEEALKDIEKDIKEHGLDNEEPEPEVVGKKSKAKSQKAAKELSEELDDGAKASKKSDSEVEETGSPLRKRKKKSTKREEKKEMAVKKKAEGATKKEAKKEKAPKRISEGGFTASDLAEELGVAPADLRKGLRDTKAKKPGASWTWPNSRDESLSKIRKNLKEHFKNAAGSSKPKSKKSRK
jgi:hypothetical protein